MQVRESRQLVALALILAVLAVVVWWQLGRSMAVGSLRPDAAVAGTPSRRPVPRPGRPIEEAGPVVVHLDWLDIPRPEPITGGRDPFAFGSGREAPEEGGPGMRPVEVAAPVAPEGPPQPPPPPPIPYRYIGLLDSRGTGRVAVLSDGRFVYHGREGDIIDGRYRLVSVSQSSVQLEYLDGRGRQTVRLSGS